MIKILKHNMWGIPTKVHDAAEKLTRLALNLTLVEKILKLQPNKKCIVYAPACFLEEEYMQTKNIEFVGIPYNLFERNRQ